MENIPANILIFSGLLLFLYSHTVQTNRITLVRMKWKKKLWISLLVSGGVLISFVFICNHIVVETAKGQLYNDTCQIPVNRVGLLLGTSSRLSNGRPNLYFNYRIEATVALFNAGKINRILVSGDNRQLNYNEPIKMRQALVAMGVPDSVIIMDYAGIRTLDSVVRAQKVFGQKSITIISQQFHNERALYIARHNGIEAVGFNARDVDTYSGFKTNTRELLARVKMFIDLLTGKEPRHLGDPIVISQA